MTTIDLTPLYRSTIGFDHWDALFNRALGTDRSSAAYPPHNIEVLAENQYRLTLAVAGFRHQDIDVQVENGVLSVRGNQDAGEQEQERQFLHRGIAQRSFERKFNLAEHVEVRSARLADGLLTVELVRELPEAMKPRRIAVEGGDANASEAIAHSDDRARAA